MKTSKFVELLYEQVVCLLYYCMKTSKFVKLLYEQVVSLLNYCMKKC